ncbi:MAG: ABC transporter ATP-binding protein [Candidatus Rokuibacteriota bacterium]
MTPLLDVRGLGKRFPLRHSQSAVHAVDDVTFSIAPGECVGLVGESGCGKSTLVRLVTRLLDPTTGSICFEGTEISGIPAARFAASRWRSQIQMVFQDPTDSLNPRATAFDTIAEPLRRLGIARDRRVVSARVHELAELCGLPRELLGRFPHQLSGGQQQRVGIARAIALSPRLLVLDEPTSALDVSVQAVILHLLADLRERLTMTYLFVSHDLNLVRLFSDRVMVMYLGKVVEIGPADRVFEMPRHPYTRALLSAVPSPDPTVRPQRILLAGEARSPVDPPLNICRFAGRCPEGFERCEREMPLLRMVGDNHEAACHVRDAEAVLR